MSQLLSANILVSNFKVYINGRRNLNNATIGYRKALRSQDRLPEEQRILNPDILNTLKGKRDVFISQIKNCSKQIMELVDEKYEKLSFTKAMSEDVTKRMIVLTLTDGTGYIAYTLSVNAKDLDLHLIKDIHVCETIDDVYKEFTKSDTDQRQLVTSN